MIQMIQWKMKITLCDKYGLAMTKVRNILPLSSAMTIPIQTTQIEQISILHMLDEFLRSLNMNSRGGVLKIEASSKMGAYYS
jgi:hypothetical protein